MKILVLTNIDSGLYLFRRELLSRMIMDGHSVFVSTPMGTYVPLLQKLGCTCLETSLDRRGVNPFKDVKLVFQYKKLIETIRPNIVFTYTIKPNIYGGLVCTIKKTPYFANITGFGTAIENPGILQKVLILLYRMGLKKADCVFCQNSKNMNFLQEHHISSKRVRLLPGSGVNLKTHLCTPYPTEDNVIRFLAVGRIMRDKGTDELLECAKVIRKCYPKVEFSLIGTYDEVEYQEKVDWAVARGDICYLGHQDDASTLMRGYHCILHPSYHEGLSNVLLEAAACGRPVIATNVAGCRETYDEGISGFGVPPRDIDALVSAVERFILLSHEEKAQMGKNARLKVEREFDRNLVIEAYLEELKSIEHKGEKQV